MDTAPLLPATITQKTSQELVLAGAWTARGVGRLAQRVDAFGLVPRRAVVVDAGQIAVLDTLGAWVLHRLLQRLRHDGAAVDVRDLKPEFGALLDSITRHALDETNSRIPVSPPPSLIENLGHRVVDSFEQAQALLAFVGECAVAFAGSLAEPARFRGRPILFNLRTAGVDALPIVGLLSFLLGIVVAYQGAGQLRQYGANIFVADLVGLSILREFAPLITAIIVAGRSGSAYAAQIGTMNVSEEIDALRTLGIPPLELLVLPKILALLIALPLLAVFADVLGVAGGMIMAHARLDVGYGEFLDRFVKAVSAPDYLVGIGKAPVFAAIIAAVGCFQGFRTRGGADSVGRQTTHAVVQSTFLVIVADAVFSVAFSALDL